MIEHWPFFMILGLSGLLTTAAVTYRIVQWRKRWDVDRYGGVLVRLDRGAVPSEDLSRELEIGCSVVREVLRSQASSLKFRVEVVKPGEVRTPTIPRGVHPRTGETIGGSIRSERAFPITEKHWVAVVVDERTAGFVAHEVLRHVLAFHVHGHGDSSHRLTGLDDLEKKAKVKIQEELQA